jgi:predicted nucleic-acid-binding protein
VLGIDTNVLLRVLVNDDPRQSPVAKRYFNQRLTQSEPGYINLIVLVETVWALRQTYNYSKTDIVRTINGILDAVELVVEDSPAVAAAVHLFQSHAIDFADALIAVRNADQGCNTTLTFDRKFAESGLARLL